MSSRSALIFSALLFLAGACGQHSQESAGSRTGADQVELSPLKLEEEVVQAINGDDVSALSSLIPARWDTGRVLKNGRTPLTEAAYLGKLAVVSALLALGADPSAPDANGEAATSFAEANPGLRRILFPDWERQQKAALVLAIVGNDFSTVRQLLSDGIPPNFVLSQAELQVDVDDAFEGETPLTLAIQLKNNNVIRTLLQPSFPTDVNGANARGDTPLRLARGLGLSGVERMLLQRGAVE